MRKHNDRGRRKFLKRLGVGATVASLAGCLDGSNDSGSDGDTNGDATPAGQTPTGQDGQTDQESQDDSDGGDGGDSKETPTASGLEMLRTPMGNEAHIMPSEDDFIGENGIFPNYWDANLKFYNDIYDDNEEEVDRSHISLAFKHMKKGQLIDELLNRGDKEKVEQFLKLDEEEKSIMKFRGQTYLPAEIGVNTSMVEEETQIGFPDNLPIAIYNMNTFREPSGELGASWTGERSWDEVNPREVKDITYNEVKQALDDSSYSQKRKIGDVRVYRNGNFSALVQEGSNMLVEIPDGKITIHTDYDTKIELDGENAEKIFAGILQDTRESMPESGSSSNGHKVSTEFEKWMSGQARENELKHPYMGEFGIWPEDPEFFGGYKITSHLENTTINRSFYTENSDSDPVETNVFHPELEPEDDAYSPKTSFE